MSELVLYVVRTTEDDHLVRGRDDAEKLSLSLAGQGHDSVSCEAVEAGSAREGYLVGIAEDEWSEGLLPLGLAAGLDIDPDNFDPYAVLLALREMIFCVDCGVRIANAEQDARAGHRPSNPRCYGCGASC